MLRYNIDFVVSPDPELELEKTLVSAAMTADGLAKVAYDLTLTNTSEEPLKAVSLSDLPGASFGTFAGFAPAADSEIAAPGAGHYTLRVVSMGSANGTATATVNAGWNGSTETELSSDGALAAEASLTLRLEFLANPPIPLVLPEGINTLSFTNTATATGEGERSDLTVEEVTATAAAAVVTPVPGLTLTKTVVRTVPTVDPETPPMAGQTLTYTFTITNSGTIAVTAFELIEPMVGEGWTWSGQSPAEILDGQVLAAGASLPPITATYKVTQADIDARTLINTATVSGLWAAGRDPVSASATADIILPAPDMTITKRVEKSDLREGVASRVGDKIVFAFDVESTGNTTLAPIQITDEGLLPSDAEGTEVAGTPENWQIASLAPGETATLYAVYAVKAEDIDAGEVVNIASAVATTATATEGQTSIERESAPSKNRSTACPARPFISC